MKKETAVFGFVFSLVVYSMMAVAYVHSTFADKGSIERVYKQLDKIESAVVRIDNKLDQAIQRGL